MNFEQQKKAILSRIDKSRKGSIDKDILNLVCLINSLPDYYTTSSCSGRIFLMRLPNSGKKNEAEWVFSKHSEVTFEEIKDALESIKDGNIWFKQEAFILHICCSSIDAASKMLDICHEAALKRAGIVALANRIMIECFSNERIETIVVENGKIVVSDDYLRIILREANKKHVKNLTKIKKLYEKITDSQNASHAQKSVRFKIL